MHEPRLDDLSVSEIMERWPRTAGVFIARRMYCVGCPIGLFHTLADAADEHQLDLSALKAAIHEAVRADPTPVRRR